MAMIVSQIEQDADCARGERLHAIGNARFSGAGPRQLNQAVTVQITHESAKVLVRSGHPSLPTVALYERTKVPPWVAVEGES